MNIIQPILCFFGFHGRSNIGIWHTFNQVDRCYYTHSLCRKCGRGWHGIS